MALLVFKARTPKRCRYNFARCLIKGFRKSAEFTNVSILLHNLATAEKRGSSKKEDFACKPLRLRLDKWVPGIITAEADT